MEEKLSFFGKLKKRFRDKINSFAYNYPRLNKLVNFFLHPVIWRVGAIASAAAVTVLTGGAAIPAAMLGLTFGASLISIAGRVIQLRGVERRRLQNHFVKSLHKKEQKLRKLEKDHSRILGALPKKKLSEQKNHRFNVPKDGKPNKQKAFYKVLRDVGLQNALSFVSISAGANILGTLTYVGGMVLSIRGVKSEFDKRVKYELEKTELKIGMNKMCEDANIPEFKNTTELYNHFKEEIIEYESKKRLCNILQGQENISAEEVRGIYDSVQEEVRERIHFGELPKSVSFTKKFLEAVNPMHKDPIEQFQDTEVDKLAQYKEAKTVLQKYRKAQQNNLRPDITPSQQRSRDQTRRLF